MTNSGSKPAVRALIFDLFGVVISFDENRVYRRLAKHCPHPEAAFRTMQGLVSTPDLITGRLTLKELYQQLVIDLGLKLDYEAFETSWLIPYTAAMPGVTSLLQELREEYRLILLSNVDRYYLLMLRSRP